MLGVFHEFGMLGCKPLKTLDHNVVIKGYGIVKFDSLLSNINQFQTLIGKLISLTIIRPSISYIFQVLSQFMHNPRKYHLSVALCVLHFLKNNLGKGVCVTKSSFFFVIKRFCGW